MSAVPISIYAVTPMSNSDRSISRGYRCPPSCVRATMIAFTWLLQPTPSLSFINNASPALYRGDNMFSRRIDAALFSSSTNSAQAHFQTLTRRRRRPSGIGALLSAMAHETETRRPQQAAPASIAKQKLLELLSNAMHGPDEHELMKKVLEVLGKNYIPIQTVGFFNMATKGDWHLCYTNYRLPPLGPRLSVESLFQRLEPGDGQKGSLTNVLEWHLLDEDIKGSMEIKCDYELDSRGRMVVSLGGHTLRPDDKMPQDPVELVKILQRAIPHEMFDPNEHAMETKFLDGNIRIVRMTGGKHEGRINVFLRDPSVIQATVSKEAEKRGEDARTESTMKTSTMPTQSILERAVGVSNQDDHLKESSIQ